MGTMNGMEPLQRLFFKGREMIQEVNDSFEQHFLWLEEVIAEARQTLASPDLVLLPKTPGRTHRVIKDINGTPEDDAENLPPPIYQSARPGRRCAKLANEKMQEQNRMSKVQKLRRPSSPATQTVTRTTHKVVCLVDSPSPLRTKEKLAPECEKIIPSSPRSSHGSCQSGIKLKPRKLSTPKECYSSPQGKDLSLTHEDSLSKGKDCPPQNNKDSSSQNDKSTSSQNDKDTSSKNDKDTSSQNDKDSSSQKAVTFQHEEESILKKDDIKQEHTKTPQVVLSPSPMEALSPLRKFSSKETVGESSNTNSHDLNNQEKTSEEVFQDGDFDNPQNKAQELPQEQEELHLHLDESFDECDGVDQPMEEQDIEFVSESPERQLKIVTTQSRGLEPKIIYTEQKKEVPATSGNSSQSSCIAASPSTSSKEEIVEVHDVSPKTHSGPPPRVTRTKQRAIEARDALPSFNNLSQFPSPPVQRVTGTKQKATNVQDIPSPSEDLPQVPVVPAPRITRTKQKAIEAQEVALENIPQAPSVPASKTVLTKQKVIEREIVPSSPISPQPAPRMTRTKQKAKDVEVALTTQETKKLTTKDEKGDTSSRVIQGKAVDQYHLQDKDERSPRSTNTKDSGVFSLGLKRNHWSSAESMSSGESVPQANVCTPPMRVTRSKMSKLQQPQHSPEKALSAIERIQHTCGSPRGTVRSQTPCKVSPVNRKLGVHSDKEGGMDHMLPEVSCSPLRGVCHSPDKTGKKVHPKLVVLGSGSHITPSHVSRMQPFLTYSSSSLSSASTGHKRIIKKTAGTPKEGRRPGNIVTNVTSFVKTQPKVPSREEKEYLRLQELQRKKDYEEDILKKKKQLLQAKAEERKRCNEERMRRAKEARQKNEQMEVAAKEQQKRERQQREARQREEEEQQRRLRQQQIVRKAEEEAKKAARLKQLEELKKKQEEEERRIKMEEEKRRQKEEEEARKKIEKERQNYLAEQKIILEEQRKLNLLKSTMMKKKDESELRQKETLRVLKEKELLAKREQEAKALMSSTYMYKNTHAIPATTTTTTTTKDTGTLNTTYTKSEEAPKTNNYEMTPAQPKRASSSLYDYGIHDIQSDDSTDDEVSPKKKIPQWAMKTQMRAALLQQEHFPPDLDDIFTPHSLLIIPDLSKIFMYQKNRFKKRTSSATWDTPPSKLFHASTSV